MKAADPSTATRPPRQRADYWMECGAAEALLRLFALLRLSVTLAEPAKLVGVSERAARRRNATHAAPAGTKWCGYGQHFPPSAEFARVPC